MTPTHNLRTQMNRYLSLCCRGLDYDFIEGRKYEFQVTATDKGTPAKTGSASVRIWMKNVNDRSPVFDPPEQRVMEFNLQQNSFVVVMIAIKSNNKRFNQRMFHKASIFLRAFPVPNNKIA